MFIPIVSLIVLFGFVASLGAILKRAQNQQETRADLLDEELGDERLQNDFGTYIEPIDLALDKCLFCGNQESACDECGPIGC